LAKENLKFDIREDGIYAIIDNSEAADEDAKVSRKDLLKKIEEYKISQVDFEAINEILSSEESFIVAKISTLTNIVVKHEAITIEASRDKMEGTISFSPPEYGGEFLTVDQIVSELNKFGINFGINMEDIGEIVSMGPTKHFDQRYPAAQGTPPTHGENGRLIYNFDITGEANHPKILADGTVDYKQIDYFTPISVGEVLAYRTNPTEGEVGTDIFGRPVSQKQGKLAPKLSKGKNVEISEDEMTLTALMSGQLVVSGKVLSISPVLDIKGDVGYETGNINFEGSVNIGGAVISGFSVTAQGNIEVKGAVEAATLKADGAINLYGGIQGRFKGRVESGGNVFTKFAQNARIIAEGNLVSNALLHCNISSNGSVLLEGDNCFIAGGTVFAAGEVRAKTIGSYMGVRTEVKVGGNPQIAGRYEQVKKEYEDLKLKYKKLNQDYEKIVQSGDVTKLDVRHKSLLLQLINHRNSVREQALKMEGELSEIISTLRLTKGRVVAEKVIHHGVVVSISNATLHLHDDITASVLRNVNGAIKAEPNTGIY
jgi:uncharacterized protein (DUF342 family)